MAIYQREASYMGVGVYIGEYSNKIVANLDIFDVVTFDTPRVDIQMISVH